MAGGNMAPGSFFPLPDAGSAGSMRRRPRRPETR